jgi:two-component system LytT family response regulator
MTTHTPDPTLNIIIVDDEIEACNNLRNILLRDVDPGINIMGIAHDTAHAEMLINQHKPDALLLDIEMPNENAFSFVQRLSPVDFEIIFVTAYDEYAVRAFRLNAIDYILKPVNTPDLAAAISKLKERIRYKTTLQRPVYEAVSRQMNSHSKPRLICLRDVNSVEVVDFKDLLFIAAKGSYSQVVFLKDEQVKQTVMSISVAEYEELLPADQFYRIHKSYLVNGMHIKQIIKDGSQIIAAGNRFSLPVGRRRHSGLLTFLQQYRATHV